MQAVAMIQSYQIVSALCDKLLDPHMLHISSSDDIERIVSDIKERALCMQENQTIWSSALKDL